MEIKIEITSRNGHDEVICQSVAQAREVIKEHSQQGKWAFVNNTFMSFDEITDQDIANAQQIRMVSALAGGQ